MTFTITSPVRLDRDRKTLMRLMQMQPDIKRSLKKLQTKRRLEDNKPGIRAGCLWIDRAKAARPARPEAGASFTLRVTPHIIPDLQRVQKYLDAKSA